MPQLSNARGPVIVRHRFILAIVIVGLYALVVVALLCWNLARGTPQLFVDDMLKSGNLIGPVGFVVGFYFGESSTGPGGRAEGKDK